jgi:hypothetical protein
MTKTQILALTDEEIGKLKLKWLLIIARRQKSFGEIALKAIAELARRNLHVKF